MMEGEMGGHVARMVSMMTAPRSEFRNLTSTRELDLSAVDIMIILKKECLINKQGGSMLSGFIYVW